jgi:hypothetical protein
MHKVVINGVVYVPARKLSLEASTYEKALAAPMTRCGDFDNMNVIDWLHELLKTLWIEEEGFSGKYPFGNSGWSSDLVYSLIECGYIPLLEGVVCSDDDWPDYSYDEKEADRLIRELIQYVFYRG